MLAALPKRAGDKQANVHVWPVLAVTGDVKDTPRIGKVFAVCQERPSAASWSSSTLSPLR